MTEAGHGPTAPDGRLILLLIAVWPANLQMVLAARAADKPPWHEALLWLRLPMQLLLIAWTWRASRSSSTETSRGARGGR